MVGLAHPFLRAVSRFEVAYAESLRDVGGRQKENGWLCIGMDFSRLRFRLGWCTDMTGFRLGMVSEGVGLNMIRNVLCLCKWWVCKV